MIKKKTIAAPWEVTANMFLSELETQSLLEYIRDRVRTETGEARIKATVDRLIVELLLFSGLRNSELCHLRIVDTIAGHGQSAVQVSGTPKQDRLVYIPRHLSRDVASFIEEIRPELISKDVTLGDIAQPLILNERGRPYDRTALYRRVVRILTDAGLAERASVQLLRHTYGFLAYKRTGGNLLFVQQQLGHAHPLVTAVYAKFVDFSYAHLANDVGGEPPVATRTPPDLPAKPTRKKGAKR